MINFTLKSVRGSFFDSRAVIGKLDAATRRALSKFGAYVWRRAKSSIRKRKGSSPPGRPPSSHTGTLKQFIFFAYEASRQSVVIGPVLIRPASGKTVPELLEYGGGVAGGGRQVFLPVVPGKGRGKSKGKRRVTLTGTITYEARPFMGPALAAELPNLEPLWRDSIR